MQPINFIGETLTDGNWNFNELVRTCFTVFWADYELAQNDFAEIGYPDKMNRFFNPVNLLYQSKIGSIRELSRGVYGDPKIAQLASKLTSRPQVDQAKQNLSIILEGLGTDLMLALQELFTLYDRQQKCLDKAFMERYLRSEDPNQKESAIQETMSFVFDGLPPHESDRILLENFFAFSKPSISFYTDYEAQIGYVGRLSEKEIIDRVAKVDITDIAGVPYSPGFYMRDDKTVYILRDLLWMKMDLLAFYPYEQCDSSFAKVGAELAGELGLSLEDRADQFRQWGEMTLFWHERGHHYKVAHLLQDLKRSEDDLGVYQSGSRNYNDDAFGSNFSRFQGTIEQLYADFLAVKELENHGNGLMKKLHELEVTSYIEPIAAICRDISKEIEYLPTQLMELFRWQTVAKAVRHERPVKFMGAIIEDLKYMLSRFDRIDYRKWLFEQLGK